jgi:hypothetical protein
MAGMFGWLQNICHAEHSPSSLGLSATSQQYFSIRTNQPPATSQQYFYLRTNQHPPSATNQTNRLIMCVGVLLFRCHNYVPPQNLGKL